MRTRIILSLFVVLCAASINGHVLAADFDVEVAAGK